jgi:hypothetical protein
MATSGRHRPIHHRRRNPWRWILVVVLVAVVAAGVAIAIARPPWLESLTTTTIAVDLTPPEVPPCPSAQLGFGSRLGTVAWVDAGALHLLDLDTCDQRVVVASGAEPPVRFSHDGTWIAFGDGAIVPAEGGDVEHPLGPLASWDWSPTANALAGSGPEGGLSVGGPDQPTLALLGSRSRVGSVAFAPDGRSVAVDLDGERVAVIDAADGTTRTIYSVSAGADAPPDLSGWTPDGRWVLFFSRFRGRTAVPLNAAPADGGDWVNVFDPVLPYDDYLSWCGRRRLALAGGAESTPSLGNQVLLSGPPGWSFRNLSEDFSRSWFWPACSPDGRWIVATVTPAHTETPPGSGLRTLWLMSVDGSERTRMTGKANAAFETPRWSADGRFLLAVRRGVEPEDPGNLILFRFDPTTGRVTRAEEPLADVGPAGGEPGHADWSDRVDWYRP